MLSPVLLHSALNSKRRIIIEIQNECSVTSPNIAGETYEFRKYNRLGW